MNTNLLYNCFHKGFKREQLRIQVKNNGILTITGEKPVNETKWSRFKKEINIAKDCDSNQIHAKFSRGILLITIPKNTAKENALSFVLRNAISRLKLSRKVALNVLVVTATFAIIGVGSYVSWKYLKPAPTDEN